MSDPITLGMNEADFITALAAQGNPVECRRGKLIVTGGGVYLPSLSTLPAGVEFHNRGGVYLGSLSTLPEGTEFRNWSYVWLRSLTALSAGVEFHNGGGVDLGSLTALPAGIEFRNRELVSLTSLTTLPDGTEFHNTGHVYLDSLTTLPAGTEFYNRGDVWLCSLTEETQSYRGKNIRLRQVDGLTMLIERERKIGDYLISRARYFGGGDLDTLTPCFIASNGEYSAHGKTAEAAIRDVRFKALQATANVDELVDEIKARARITFNEFRLLTGACDEGLRHGLQQAGINPDTEEMPLSAALAAAHGPYGEQFKEMMA